MLHSMHSRFSGAGLVLILALVSNSLSPIVADKDPHGGITANSNIMYVWAGGNGNKDFIAVVDFNPSSPTYSTILSRIYLPANKSGISQINNEPHHCRVSDTNAGPRLALGGLLSFLQGTDDIFVFDVTNPFTPTFSFSSQVSDGACIDEFNPYNGGFLVTAMCNKSAGAPGDIAFIDPVSQTTQRFVNGPMPSDSNPHGFDYFLTSGNSHHGTLISTDFILPISLLPTANPPLLLRNTLRVFDMSGNLQNTYTVPGGGGFMDFKYHPSGLFGAAGGTLNNLLYYMSSTLPPTQLFDLTQLNGGNNAFSAGIMAFTSDGNYLLLTYALRYVVSLRIDISQFPAVTATLVQSFDFCVHPELVNCSALSNYPGSHYIRLTYDETRFTVVNYFLNFGLAQFTGSQSVHAFNFNKQTGTFSLDTNFNLSFASENSSPHSVAYIADNTPPTPSPTSPQKSPKKSPPGGEKKSPGSRRDARGGNSRRSNRRSNASSARRP